MLNQERRNAILDILEEKGSVSVSELTKRLNASESTIRRDLIALSKWGKLNKVHGGATLNPQEYISSEAPVCEKRTKNIEEKQRIAKYCASQIHDDDFVYLDAGTTTLFMIDYINSACKATFVTNGISHAKRLLQKGLNVYILGGMLKTATEAVIGLVAANNIHNYNFTKAFLGTNGITESKGFSTPDTEEAFVKAAAMENAFVSYVLADSTKFGKVSAVNFASVDRACIVTDKPVDDIYKNKTVIKVVD